MKNNKNIILFAFTFIITLNINAANRYWIDGTGNWTSTSHWAATSGGTTDNILPTSSDDIYIDALSGAGTITTITNITISYLDFMAGCSAITLQISANTFTVTNDFYQNTSATNSNTRINGGTLIVNNISINAGVFTATSGTATVNGTSFGISGGTANFNGATINVGNSTNEFLRVYSGNLNISSGTINVKDFLYTDNGGLTISGGTINVGTGLSVDYWATVYLQGTNTITGGILNVQAIQTGGSSYALFIAGSTFSGGSTKINVTNANYSISSPTLYNLEINSPGVTASFYSTLAINGDFILTNGTATLNGYTITTTGLTNLINGTFQATSGTYNSIGTGVVFALNGATFNIDGATINIGDNSDEIFRVYSGILNHSAGTINVRNYISIDANGSTFSGGTINAGTGGNVSYTTVYILGTATFSGNSIIDVKNVPITGAGGAGTGIAIDINSSSVCSGGIFKVTAVNSNYRIYPRKAFNLEINSSGYTASLMSSMSIYGDLTVSAGSLTSSVGTVNFLGSIAQSILGTSATLISLNSLALNNTLGLTIAPSSGIETTVKNTLTLTNGKITLGNYTLGIGSLGISGNISGGTSSNFIITNGTGVLKQYNIGTGQRTSAFYPIGQNSTNFNPITLTISGASTVDYFSIRVCQNVLVNGTSGAAYVSDVADKTWHISEGTAAGSSLTITPQWNTSNELSSFSRGLAEVRHYTGGVWNSEGGSALSGSNPYTLTSGVITSFSPFGIFDPVSLPIELLEFNAIKNEDKVDLNWSTSAELNNDYFKILKSINGVIFEEVEKIDGNGNSMKLIDYSTVDRNPFTGISYYKLAQYDFNGIISYSEIRSVNFENEGTSIYPNPSNGDEINISLSKTINKENIEIKILDELGRLIYTENSVKNPAKFLKLNNDILAKGIYIINIESSNEFNSIRLIIK